MCTQVLATKRVRTGTQAETSIIGRPLKRKEDPRILAGRTKFLDDIKLPGMLFGAVLRSSYAHAMIKKIDTSALRKIPGIRLILSADDLPESASSLPVIELEDGTKIKRPVLVRDEVSYVGEPIAFLVADSKYNAEDAIEAISVEYEPVEAILDPEAAIMEDSPQAHLGLRSNLVLVEKVASGDINAEFSRAERVVKLDFLNQRVAPVPLEPRGSIAYFDEAEQMLNVWISTQGPFQARSDLSDLLQLPENKIRVRAPDVGGGFGAKLSLYSEDVLVCFAALRLGRPIKWFENRSENLSAMTHGRGQIQHVEVAATGNGRILGLKVRIIGDAGAYLTDGSSDATYTLKMCPGQYMIPAYQGEAMIALTNKVPHDAYRGASRPEATYLIERTMDELACELKIDPAEIRFRNFIPAESFPFRTVGGLEYDSGNYAMNLEKALEDLGYDRWRREQKTARASGRLVGIGLSSYVEVCGFGPNFPQTAAMWISESGKVTVVSGTSPHGQGHETPLAQIAAEVLGISIEDVSVTYGDTSIHPWGTYTAGSRSGALGGSAVLMCAEKIRDKMSEIAARALRIPKEELIFRDGQVFSEANPKDADEQISFSDLASYAYEPEKLPEGMEPVLYAFSCFVPTSNTFTFGSHIAVVEIEQESGRIRILDYVSVDDCGNVLNPIIVEGQFHGGIAQGLGQALLEEVKYNESGQLLTSNLSDYHIPLAEDIPNLRCSRTVTPTKANPLGIKGVGEAGTIAATPAIANAVGDALSTLGIKVKKMPFTLEYVRGLATGS